MFKKIKVYSQHMAWMPGAPFWNRSCVIRGSRKKKYFSDSLNVAILPKFYVKEIKYGLHRCAPKSLVLMGQDSYFWCKRKLVCVLCILERGFKFSNLYLKFAYELWSQMPWSKFKNRWNFLSAKSLAVLIQLHRLHLQLQASILQVSQLSEKLL